MVCTVDGLTGHVVMLLLLCHRATDVAGSLHHEKLPSAPSVRPSGGIFISHSHVSKSMKLLNDSNGPLPTHISLFDSISKKEPSLLYFYTYRLR